MNYYQILGVSKTATEAEIHKAFRLLARKYHPDAKPYGDAEKMKAINAAYETLKSPSKRRKYDMLGQPLYNAPPPPRPRPRRKPVRETAYYRYTPPPPKAQPAPPKAQPAPPPPQPVQQGITGYDIGEAVFFALTVLAILGLSFAFGIAMFSVAQGAGWLN